MRRGRSLLAIVTVAILGGYAKAGPESSTSASDLAIRQIEAFIAEQRRADAQTCTESGLAPGTVQHDACIRDLAAKRRAQIEGVTTGQPMRAGGFVGI